MIAACQQINNLNLLQNIKSDIKKVELFSKYSRFFDFPNEKQMVLRMCN